ncbi:Serine/threonine-protein kinase HipA [Legionella massiliensis]|uniref:Serine/threonine-protein kinase HipA n=1 Tax=Legionella massiliensis TaxID=1034943 RepID=A0A078KW12_9GAMM|nr:type II toxin-antitoxin system HipA family toxin [Legionella massiliensis]CDZ78640.1 Serine/threonine-protein kinase HipA [Legionella massiliensis]CEE14378.1 Serine/threonine-protein kinase HipA [Legionella massiliensis]
MKTHKLDVYLNQILVGQLSIDSYGDMTFIYNEVYLENENNLPLSLSLPLQKTAYSAKQCHPFFNGLLPEAHLRISIARQLGISGKNDFALLAAIGGECAGAVSLLPESLSPSSLQPDYHLIDDNAVLNILQTMRQKPMLAGEDGIRLSLAGAQDKLAVALIDGHIAIPMNGAPSTHILKPINRNYPSLIENECFCLGLARKIGLNTAEASMHKADDTAYLLVKRYDRVKTEKGIQRLHQEDFCQAMGINSEMKYQREGGPGISDCFQLVRASSSIPVVDIKQLLQGVLFNLIIGNNDAHGKNFSFIYKGQQTRLAPFYDLISTVYYPNLATKMAMKMGNKYDFDGLFPRHIVQMAEEAMLSAALVRKEAQKLISKIQTHIAESPFTATILQRAEKLSQRLQTYSE